MKRHDSTRPASAGQSATLELDTMHNPISLERMKEREDVRVPIMWDEAMAPFQGDLWGDTREMWIDPGDRDYYIQPLIPVWDAVQTSKNVQASIIWAWVDDAFLVPGRDSEYGRGSIGRPLHFLDYIYRMPGRGIVGDAPWGIVDTLGFIARSARRCFPRFTCRCAICLLGNRVSRPPLSWTIVTTSRTCLNLL